MEKDKKVALVICDGMGYRESEKYNAVKAANTPNLDRLMKEYPSAIIAAGGEAIGLPAGQMGTSEANHLIIGSGRIVYQNLLKINRSIKEGSFEKNAVLIGAINHSLNNDSYLHVIGLLGPGGVHAHIDHIKEIALVAKDNGLERVAFHFFTDGRDTPPKSSIEHLNDFSFFIETNKIGRIASLGGRYWGMDRDNNEERVEKAYDAIVLGKGVMYADPIDAINESYGNGITDEFIVPVTIGNGEPPVTIKENDAAIFANFRADRANQLTRRILQSGIPGLHLVTMTKYADDIAVPAMFPPEVIEHTLSEELSRSGIKQLRVTETDKFAHLTFFFNAQKSEPDPLEERVMIPTNKDVATHDKKPEMKAAEIAEVVAKAIKEGNYGFIAANIVNCDIVAHSGDFEATKRAVEAVDEAVGKIAAAAEETGAQLIITADHGNAEEMWDEKANQPMTSHTMNPVPLVLVSRRFKKMIKSEGSLSDIAPTILTMLDVPLPKEMTGESLV